MYLEKDFGAGAGADEARRAKKLLPPRAFDLSQQQPPGRAPTPQLALVGGSGGRWGTCSLGLVFLVASALT